VSLSGTRTILRPSVASASFSSSCRKSAAQASTRGWGAAFEVAWVVEGGDDWLIWPVRCGWTPDPPESAFLPTGVLLFAYRSHSHLGWLSFEQRPPLGVAKEARLLDGDRDLLARDPPCLALRGTDLPPQKTALGIGGLRAAAYVHRHRKVRAPSAR
jgi:hypothetical protein